MKRLLLSADKTAASPRFENTFFGFKIMCRDNKIIVVRFNFAFGNRISHALLRHKAHIIIKNFTAAGFADNPGIILIIFKPRMLAVLIITPDAVVKSKAICSVRGFNGNNICVKLFYGNKNGFPVGYTALLIVTSVIFPLIFFSIITEAKIITARAISPIRIFPTVILPCSRSRFLASSAIQSSPKAYIISIYCRKEIINH